MDFNRIDAAVDELSDRRYALGDLITAYRSASDTNKPTLIEAILVGLDELERAGNGLHDVLAGECADRPETSEMVQ